MKFFAALTLASQIPQKNFEEVTNQIVKDQAFKAANQMTPTDHRFTTVSTP